MPDPPTNEERVYVFKELELWVDGAGIPVSSVRLDLGEQDIPSLRVVVDPEHSVGDPHEPASVATMDTIADASDTFQEAANTRSTLCDFKVEVHNVNGVQQKIDLKGWILTAAGITNVSAAGAFALELTIQHPIVNMDLVSANLGNVDSKLEFSATDYADIVAAFSGMFKEYAQAERIAKISEDRCESGKLAPLQPELGEITDAIKERMEEVADELPDRLKWDDLSGTYSGWPLQNGCLDLYLSSLQVALATYVTGMGQNTVWEAFVGGICPHWSVTIIPTYYEDFLKLRPYSPWMKPSVKVYDDEISDLSFPGVDSAPIAAVIVTTYEPSGLDGAYSSLNNNKKAEKRERSPAVVYAPPKVVSGDMFGTTLQVGGPPWLSNASFKDAAAGGIKTAPGPREAENLELTPANTVLGTEPTSEPDDMLKRGEDMRLAHYHVAHAVFLQEYRHSLEVTFNCPLLFLSENSDIDKVGDKGYVVPGHVMQVISRETERVIFDFYCTDVVHTIDFAGGFTRTEVRGCYARPTGETMKNITWIDEDGTPNPLWSKL